MKSGILPIFSLICFLVFYFPATAADHASGLPRYTGNFDVQVTGLPNNKGVVRIALFNSGSAYKAAGFSPKGAYRSITLPISNKQAHWHIERLPYDYYAIKLFHDEDKNGKIKTNFFGLPKKGYGFSNNHLAKFGPPDFKEAVFLFDKKQQEIEIEVRS
jgi:uncharacterized protein (DUF2141 family)